MGQGGIHCLHYYHAAREQSEMSWDTTVRHAAEANKRSKQLLKEHFQELEGGREDNSSGAEDDDDEDEVSSPPWPLLVPHACDMGFAQLQLIACRT